MLFYTMSIIIFNIVSLLVILCDLFCYVNFHFSINNQGRSFAFAFGNNITFALRNNFHFSINNPKFKIKKLPLKQFVQIMCQNKNKL